MASNVPTVYPVLQAMFDTMVNGIKKQNRLCKEENQCKVGMNSLPVCYYRHPQDSSVRCVMGHLIPDEMYEPEMENFNAMGLLRNYPDVAKHLAINSVDHYDRTGWENPRGKLLRYMQSVHDQSDSVHEFMGRAAKVAKEFNLNDKVTQ